MKKIACLAAVLLLSAAMAAGWNSVRRAWAGVACSMPFTFANNTTADATQVNANFASVVTCLASAASAGTNSDITTLAGLTTPLAAGEGGATSYTATTTSTGTANAQVIAATTPSGFTLVVGRKIRFVSGFNNTDIMSINVAGTGTIALNRVTPGGIVGMVGGEIVTGQLVEAVYDGALFQMVSNPALYGSPGFVFDYAGSSCPVGSLEANAATPSASGKNAPLAGILGTLWGNPGGGNFALPDMRGRANFGRDSGGSGRITVAQGNFDGTAVGGGGGQQSQVLTVPQLPVVTPVFTGTQQTWNISSVFLIATTAGGADFSGGGVKYNTSTPQVTLTPAGTISSFGSGFSHPVLAPAAIVLKCVKV